MTSKNKKILIINRQYNINALFYFFKELNTNSISLILYSVDGKIIKKFHENNLTAFSLKRWPVIDSAFSFYLFLFFFPITLFYILLRLSVFKYRHKINTVLVINAFDKVFTTKAAKLLKLKTITISCPEVTDKKYLGMYCSLGKALSRKNNILCFSEKSHEILRCHNYTNIKKIVPGIKLGLGHQDNIFNNLARENDRILNKKFFSIGTVLDLNKKHNFETIFSSLKQSQTIIPNLQFIIIGDGPEKKNLRWLSKKMEIESIVWFVGEQKCLKKWLNGLDVYLYAVNQTSLADINYALLAMHSALPIIGPKNDYLENIVQNFKHGLLLENNSSEEWMHNLIRLEQNKKTRIDMGKRAKLLVEQNHTVEKMSQEFLKYL